MSIRIKNCGLKTPEAVHEAARTGAHFVGFVHYLPSPRHLGLEEMANLSQQTPNTLRQVVVMVDPSDDLLNDLLLQFRPHYFQLHRVANPNRIHDISQRTGIPAITAINVNGKADLTYVAALEDISAYLLFDAYDPQHGGGSGKAFDWALLKQVNLHKSWFLAGGLTADNVGQALKTTGAPMVDVSSGIESSPGIKSLEKIAAFNEAVLRHG